MTKRDLVPSVCRLLPFDGGKAVGRGTVWYLGEGLWLTAAHCIGDASRRVPFSGPFRIQTGPGEATAPARLVNQEWSLDVAYLALEVASGSEIMPLPTGVLPKPDQFPIGLPWYAYGFPRAHTAGLHLDGDVTSPRGNVGGIRAIQLRCAQGGLGGLQGISGGPVCVGGVAVGVIRFGPEELKQAVIMATGMEDIVGCFPALKGLRTQEPAGSVPAILPSSPNPAALPVAGNLSDPSSGNGSSATSNTSGAAVPATATAPVAEESTVLLLVLMKMLPAAFALVVHKSRAPKAQLLPDRVNRAERAIELVDYFDSRPGGLSTLRNAIAFVDMELLDLVSGSI